MARHVRAWIWRCCKHMHSIQLQLRDENIRGLECEKSDNQWIHEWFVDETILRADRYMPRTDG